MLATNVASSLLKPSSFTRTDPTASQKGLYIFTVPVVHESFLHIPYCSIALVELANESAAEQACTKLNET